MWNRGHDTGRIWSWMRGVRVAVVTAVAGLAFLSLAGSLEETYGLGTLFRVRGPLMAPSEIAIVAIDRASADSLDLPGPPLPWPRTVHADLIRALDRFGVAAIVFDQHFTTAQSTLEDEEFAAALRVSGRVVLLQRLEQQLAPTSAENGKEGREILIVDPIPPLRKSALAVGTFPVPVDADVLTSFWTFLSGTDMPTLPSIAFQLSAADLADDWSMILKSENLGPRDALAWRDQRIAESMTELRAQLREDPGAGVRLAEAIGRLDPSKATRLSALLGLYAGEDSRQLNFFGPAGTIPTISYASVIGNDNVPDLKGKIVFVGISERQVVSQIDTYETPYSRNGIDMSGVEILATSMVNLRDNESLRTSGMFNISIVVLGALVFGLAAASASDLILGIVSIALLLAIPALAYALFVSANFVAPLFTPLIVQLPIGILTIGLSLKAAERRLRYGLDNAVRQFLPQDVADRLTRGPLSASDMPASRIVSAIFLATDVQGFTTLAERLSLPALDALAKDYFGPLFESVVRHRGEILNVTADSTMSAWYMDQQPARARGNAVAAVMSVARLVEDFAARHPSTPMPTRFGLRAGSAALGVVGHSDRFVPSVVGDVTNTASRIASLNKPLKTTILASAEVVANVDGLVVRPLGTFAPVGKFESVDVVEILGNREQMALANSFAACLAVFDREEWSDAARQLRTLHQEYPDDGPTSFFLDLAEKYSIAPPLPGTARPIRLDVK
jgi:adenylate cyclase